MCTPSERDITRGDVLHHARRAPALGVDQEVRVRVGGAHGVDVVGPDARMHMALAVPDVQPAAERLLDVGAEKHVGAEQDLGVLAVLAEDVRNHLHGVG